MCGFAGVIAWDEKYRVGHDTLAKMSAAIAHRGPDGEGFHLTKENEPITPDSPQVGLAFRRLAILDPDPRSDQPFHIGPLTLVFNGEIYNFRELRGEISKLRPDYQWRTSGDTEVLLMAYEIWREKCVEKLNGMFALAVWDEQKKELFVARDRMGQKPLYFIRLRGVLAFSSEIAGLTALIPSEISSEAVAFYLAYGYGPAPRTIYPGVEQVPPGHIITFTAAQRATVQYFDPDDWPAARLLPPATTDQFRQMIQTAVRRQLVSDVPLGVFLSGGIDSSVIAACARQEGAVRTFTIRFDDPRYDESPHAAAVAKHLGTEHETFHASPQIAADFPQLAATLGEPFADSSVIPTHYLARETRQRVKVALSGDGGDELFGGYDRYRAMRLAGRLTAVSALAPLGKKLHGHPKSHAARLGRFLGSLNLPASQRYDSYMRFFSDVQIAELIPGAKPQAAVGESFQAMRQIKSDDVTAALATDRRTYLPNDLLTKLDRASMLHNLEVRSPFMDQELVQFAAGLTTDQLLKGGPKRMLREAFAADLPEFVFKRKKMGFAVPIGEWFRGKLRAMLRDHLFAADSFAKSHFNMLVVERLIDEHEQEQIDHSQRLYALLMLELWWRWHRGLAT